MLFWVLFFTRRTIGTAKKLYFCVMRNRLTLIFIMLISIGIANADEPALRLAFAGDVMMGTNFPDTANGAYLPANDGADLLRHVTPILSQADLAAANLEGTLLNSGGKLKECKDSTLLYAFRTPTAYVANLKRAGFDFMSLANNHINDFGHEGRQSTRAALRDANIGFAGLKSDTPWHIAAVKGRKVGFTAFSPNAGTLSIHDYKEMRRIVAHLDSVCDVVVVSFHGGGEGAKYQHVTGEEEECFNEKRGNVRKFARAAVEAGADVVYGHGPHVTRAMELYRDRLIIYSLGNFCTPYRVNLSGISGHAPVVTVDIDGKGQFVGGQIHPFVQVRGKGPQPDRSGAVIRQIRNLTRADFPYTPLKITPDGHLKK